jgi:glycerol-3-phosphate O-acyltransferase
VLASRDQRVLQTYYRNNVVHLFAASLGRLLLPVERDDERPPTSSASASCIYPFIKAELFLPWDEAEVETVVAAQLAALAVTGVLQQDSGTGSWHTPPASSPRAMQLSLLAQPTLQTVERYYLAIALLKEAGSGAITQAELEKRCQQRAQQMGTLYGFHSPEFFDRSLFEGFISLMRRRGVLRADGEGRLLYDEVLDRIVDDAQLVLSGVLRHSVLQIARA